VSVELAECPPVELLSHLALYGAAAIAEDSGVSVTVSWTDDMDPRPRIDGVDAEGLGELVAAHAARERPWLDAGLPHDPTHGLFSPRVKAPSDRAGWGAYQEARHQHLDAVESSLDAAFLAALGEQAYWFRNAKREVEGDRGASRYDMQPRNQGSELVGSRVRPLAVSVGTRTPSSVTAGLVGELVSDPTNGPRSRTGANFRPLGPTDSAVAWCALWGVSQLPVTHQAPAVRGGAALGVPSRTAGHVPRPSNRRGDDPAGSFVLPLFAVTWRLPRLRHVLASRALADAGLDIARGNEVGARWLTDRGVRALVRFPVRTGGSISAPERRAMRGELRRL
jgi:CRISPR-associated protein Csb3